MCCLFGMVDYGHSLNGRQKSRLISILAAECEERGKDAAGVAYNSRGHLHIYKRPLPAHKLRIAIPDDAWAVMGHTRLTTQGSEKRNYNNHPFLGVAGGKPFALAHNGVLYNDRSLRKAQRLPNTKIETDSYVAVQLLEKSKALDLTSLKNMAEKVEGSFTFSVLDGRDNLYFVKGDSPLCLLHFPRLKLYLYASIEALLDRAVKKLGLPLGKQKRVEAEVGEILRLDQGGEIAKSEFDASRLYQRGYFWGYSPLCVSVSQGNQDEYIQQLKAVANSCGYTPGAVDRMLQHGFTPEEIEEFLYCGEI